MSCVMFCINVIQIALIRHICGTIWMVGFPAVVFGTMCLVLMVGMYVNRVKVVKTWRKADGEPSLPA